MTSSSSSDELDIKLRSPDINNAAQALDQTLLPAKSLQRYINNYESFLKWRNERNTNSLSESVFLAYFGELATKYKPSSLWANYSMLKSTLKTKNNINIKNYLKLTAFLKTQSDGYHAKKCKVLTGENIEYFINNAPDDRYLATKVALIFGVTGACRRQELADITENDIENHKDMLIIKIRNTQNKVPRCFTIRGQFYKIVKKYEALRSKKGSNRFFQNYHYGKCTAQPIGKNKFGNMPKEIAEYLNLPDAKSYTGRSFRGTSATLLAGAGALISKDTALRTDAGAAVMTLTEMNDLNRLRRGGGKSGNVAEGYLSDSIDNKEKISIQITNSILQSRENVESVVVQQPSKKLTNVNTAPQPSKSYTSEAFTPQPQPQQSTSATLCADETSHFSNNLSQTIQLPGKNISLNFNNCNVTINFK